MKAKFSFVHVCHAQPLQCNCMLDKVVNRDIEIDDLYAYWVLGSNAHGQQNIGNEQSEDKVDERFSWYLLLNHLTGDVSVWL